MISCIHALYEIFKKDTWEELENIDHDPTVVDFIHHECHTVDIDRDDYISRLMFGMDFNKTFVI